MSDETETNPFKVRRSVADLEDAPEASNNLPRTQNISMTFNMPPDWHRRFRMEAASRGIKHKQLFEECWEAYVREKRREGTL